MLRALPARVARDASEVKVIHLGDCVTSGAYTPLHRSSSPASPALSVCIPSAAGRPAELAAAGAASQLGARLSASACSVPSWMPVAMILPVCVP